MRQNLNGSQKILLGFCLAILLLLATQPVNQISLVISLDLQDTPFSLIGPYIDQITLKIQATRYEQLADLSQGEIDQILDPIDSSYYDIWWWEPILDAWWVEAESFDIGILAINCFRYPYSIAGFRRALAFAIDKDEVAKFFGSGFGFAINSPISPAYGIWHNGTLDPDYSRPQTSAAKDELRKTGFRDYDGDGFVEAPDGSDFTFTILYPQEKPLWGAILRSQQSYWDHAGIPVEIRAITETELGQRLFTVPRDYDGAYVGLEGELHTLFSFLSRWKSTEISNPQGNFLHWANDTYDNSISDMEHSPDFDRVFESVHAAQQIFLDNQPMIPLYGYNHVFWYRTDRFENWMNSPGHGIGLKNPWVPRLLQLQEGQPDRDPVTGCGGHYTASTRLDLVTVNPLKISNDATEFITSQIYCSLAGLDDPRDHSIKRNTGNLAYDWILGDIPNGLQIDFKIYNNATWHDGEPVTVDDIKFTYDYIASHSIPRFSKSLTYFNSCSIIDDETIRIVTKFKSFAAFNAIRDWPILPKHIWEGIINPLTFENSVPIGCGSFRWFTYSQFEKIELRYWSLYHRGVPGHCPPNHIICDGGGPWQTLGMIILTSLLAIIPISLFILASIEKQLRQKTHTAKEGKIDQYKTQMTHCPRCRTKLFGDERFCPGCGNPVLIRHEGFE